MTDWKEKLKNLAAQQGIPSHASPPPSPPRRALPQQMRKIHADRNPRYNRRASAPYNFVPLNAQVVAVAPFRGFDAYETQNRKTGFIECEIEAVTPLYIRGAGPANEPAVAFFAPAGNTKIPASSWRGMTRTLVEILTWSQLATDEKRLFYYRGLADQSNLRQEYQSHMSSYNAKAKSTTYKMSAGYLEKYGVSYRIVPARKINGRPFAPILKSETAKALAKTAAQDIFIYPGGDKTAQCFFRHGANTIVISGKMPNKKRDWLIHPPDAQAPPILIPPEDVRSYQLDENRTGPNLIAALERLASFGEAHEPPAGETFESLPCFYVEWTDNDQHPRVSFGHTAMFRLAYEQGPGDLLPEGYRWNLREAQPLDMAEAIFGTVFGNELFAGRVYFEDAVCLEASPPALAAPAGIPHILSAPKPTTFQHYLVQTSDFIRELRHYNAATVLRGHKLYWHRRCNWQAQDLTFHKAGLETFLQKKGLQIPPEHRAEKNGKLIVRNFPALQSQTLKAAIFEFVRTDEKSQYTVIQPVPPGTRFKGKIRFENLTDVELGALWSALQLPANCRHKLGMGKPLGLGSVKITPKLFLSDRQKRYSSLQHEWTTPPQPENEETVNAMQAAFERFMLQHLDGAEKPASGRLWEAPRLRQLQAMLSWENTAQENWTARTRYLEIEHAQNGNEYKARPVLPGPEEVALRLRSA